MITYLDASALVKRYVEETGTTEINTLIAEADAVATNLISRAEVAAGIMRASRMKIINQEEAFRALTVFRSEWESLQRLAVSEATVARADSLVCDYNLRGYDAVHLASAIIWQEAIGETVIMATFDTILSAAAQEVGMSIWPE
ncbi:MAG: PIN domain-containing protein [Anaerolineales bacterium]|nr:PIN domain-containing protein [Anaerolineales bacterium]